MPNHVTNEIIFRNVTKEQQDAIIANLCDGDGNVDFSVLVPLPLNMWCGNVSKRHEEAFKRTALDWCRDNWGTKWNAYDHGETERTDDTLTLIFDTAWRPPYPWLAAVFNKLNLSFEHNWLSEGEERGHHGVFKCIDNVWGDEWNEEYTDDELQRHLHKLRWGCEEFEDDE